MNIILRSERLKVKKVISKTKAKMFCDLKVGDCIELSVEVERAGSNRGRTYASYIICTNVSTLEKTAKSFNEINRFLCCFELEEIYHEDE